MQAQVSPLDGSMAIGITFTDKPVTAFGGLALLVAFAQLALLRLLPGAANCNAVAVIEATV